MRIQGNKYTTKYLEMWQFHVFFFLIMEYLTNKVEFFFFLQYSWFTKKKKKNYNPNKFKLKNRVEWYIMYYIILRNIFRNICPFLKDDGIRNTPSVCLHMESVRKTIFFFIISLTVWLFGDSRNEKTKIPYYSNK